MILNPNGSVSGKFSPKHPLSFHLHYRPPSGPGASAHRSRGNSCKSVVPKLRKKPWQHPPGLTTESMEDMGSRRQHLTQVSNGKSQQVHHLLTVPILIPAENGYVHHWCTHIINGFPIINSHFGGWGVTTMAMADPLFVATLSGALQSHQAPRWSNNWRCRPVHLLRSNSCDNF